MSHDDPDHKERLALERGLRELGYDAASYQVEVTALPMVASNAVARMARKAVVVTGPGGDQYRHETYADKAWAGEILIAIVEGKLA
jgi:hypothetical protein